MDKQEVKVCTMGALIVFVWDIVFTIGAIWRPYGHWNDAVLITTMVANMILIGVWSEIVKGLVDQIDGLLASKNTPSAPNPTAMADRKLLLDLNRWYEGLSESSQKRLNQDLFKRVSYQSRR